MRELKFRVWSIEHKNWDNPSILEVWNDSGILDCCIIFWLTKFSGKFKTKVMYNNKEANDYFDKLSEKWVVTYIACPSCFKSKKFIEIKKCNCGL